MRPVLDSLEAGSCVAAKEMHTPYKQKESATAQSG
jgi:hypothetical protein